MILSALPCPHVDIKQINLYYWWDSNMGTYACLREVKFACSECNQLLRGIDLLGSLESPACHERLESFYYGRRLNARTQF